MDQDQRPQNPREIEENNAWDHLSKWESLVEDRIRRMIGDGDMSWHPKAGQPFVFDDESYTPEEQRLANKIMKDNDTVPAWMSLGFTLRDKHDKIMRRLRQYARDYVKRKDDANRKGSYVLFQHAEDRWHKALRDLRRDIDLYNSDLLTYNLQVPSGVSQMIPLDADQLIADVLRQAQSH
jgi:hypothetical protein